MPLSFLSFCLSPCFLPFFLRPRASFLSVCLSPGAFKIPRAADDEGEEVDAATSMANEMDL